VRVFERLLAHVGEGERASGEDPVGQVYQVYQVYQVLRVCQTRLSRSGSVVQE
jgi:hypothetical protein